MRAVPKEEIPCQGHGGLFEEWLTDDPFEVGIAPQTGLARSFGRIGATLQDTENPTDGNADPRMTLWERQSSEVPVMKVALLAAVLYAAAAEQDPLLKQLQAEFDNLVRDDPHALELRQAEMLLRQTNQSSHWTNYSKATALLRKARSRAAVPLLLKYMIEHSEFSTSHVVIPEYADTISVLTGKKIDNPYLSGPDGPKILRQQVEKLFHQWWLPNKASVGIDQGKMSREQLEIVVDGLVEKTRWERDYSGSGGGEGTAYRVYHILFYRVMNRSRSVESRWQPDGLHRDMTPILLARTGYRPDATVAGDSGEVDDVPYAVVDLLAELRKNQEAPQLDRIAADPKQCSAARLTCILAMYAAGEELDTPSLLSILDNETRLELRLVTIISLMHSRDTKQVVPRLVKLLDDRNAEIRTAAVCALRGPKPPEAVPKLKAMIDELAPEPAMVFVFDVIGEIGTEEAQQALAEFMVQALKGSRKSKYISDALDAFETATDQRWRSAGAHDDAYYRQKACEALVWWKSQQAPSGPVVLAQLRQVVKEMDPDQDGRIDVRRTMYLRGSEPVLVCLTQFARDGSPKTVINSVFYQGQTAYVDALALSDRPSFLTRTYAESGASLGFHSDGMSDSYVLLFDPGGDVVAIFERESDGKLKPVDAEHFRRIRKQYLAAQAAADELLPKSP
jgi:hypothetical protein